MRRTRTVSAAIGRGIVFHTAFTAVALGALTAWAHACEARRRHHARHAAA